MRRETNDTSRGLIGGMRPKRRTKHQIGLVALSLTFSAFPAFPAFGEFYEPLQFRANDPFVFCQHGYEPTIANACWIPLSPATGTSLPTGMCDPPNTYGRPWTARDYQALQQYIRVCPQAISSGEWRGNGDSQSTPFQH